MCRLWRLFQSFSEGKYLHFALCTLHFAFEQLLDKPEFDGKLWILSGVYMDILEQIRAWLEIRGYLPGIDSCGLAPGETGLFPLGMEQRSLREDVL